MRYVKLLLAALLAMFIVFHINMNMEEINKTFIFRFGSLFTPWKVAAGIEMPYYLGLAFVFIIGFSLAVFFEISTWYKFEKTIHKQRQQILALQKHLGIEPENPSGQEDNHTDSSKAG